MHPGKKPTRKLPPPQKNVLPKKGFTSFPLFFDIVLQLFSFRGGYRTPATSIMDLLATLVNGIN